MKKWLIGAISSSFLFVTPSLVFAVTPGTPTTLPEPAGLFLIAAGLIGVWGFRKIFKK